jgi:hypothetical protein
MAVGPIISAFAPRGAAVRSAAGMILFIVELLDDAGDEFVQAGFDFENLLTHCKVTIP